jgi:hypothetical protein
MPAQDTVRVYDFATKQIMIIPAAELAPGMVCAQVEGIEGEVWIDAKGLKEGPFRHPPFGEEVRAHLRRLQDVLHDVYPITVEQWEEGFRRDADPEPEIATWLRIADVYEHFTEGHALDQEHKRDIFDVILACVNNGKDYVSQTTSPRTLSRARVREIAAYLFPPKG